MVYAQYGLELGDTAEVAVAALGEIPVGELSGKANGVRVGSAVGAVGALDAQAVNRMNGNSI